MARALRLAEQGMYTAMPNPRVGCVLVRDGEVVGEGWHERAGDPHAEINALADARAHGHDPRGATAYVTLEPCAKRSTAAPACADRLIQAGIARIVIAARDPHPNAAGAGLARLRAAGIAVEIGLMEAEARAQNAAFFAKWG
jgi:diaminohydroxyphosphoribosylaminopyrimidine deaminase/5-amino-6-(5-phosphoribosylamino)uracil reductase